MYDWIPEAAGDLFDFVFYWVPSALSHAQDTVKYQEMFAEWELSDERMSAMCQWVGHGCFWGGAK